MAGRQVRRQLAWGVLVALTFGGPAESVPKRLRFTVDVHEVFDATTVGPLASITCPGGAVSVGTGADLQTAVDANPGATTFCLAAGVHSVTSSVVPKSGNTFIGAYGAILDGTSWVTADTTQAAFRSHNEDIDDVTIKNLVIRNMPQRAIHAYYQYSDRWIIDHNELGANNSNGAVVPNGSTLMHNKIHGNVIAANGNGGGYIIFRSTNVMVRNNEFYANGSEGKIAHAFNVYIRNNWYHDETYNSIWFDGDSPGGIVEDNLIEDSGVGAGGTGIFLEVAQSITVRRNTIRRSGWNGISLATSQFMNIYSNVIEDVGSIAFPLHMECSRGGINADLGNVDGGSGDLADKWDLADNNIHDNSVRLIPGTYAASFNVDEADVDALNDGTCPDKASYLNNSKNNNFVNNSYDVPTPSTGTYWLWGQTPLTQYNFTDWKGTRGQDTTGSAF